MHKKEGTLAAVRKIASVPFRDGYIESSTFWVLDNARESG